MTDSELLVATDDEEESRHRRRHKTSHATRRSSLDSDRPRLSSSRPEAPDPTAFAALGQSIAQQIAQFMTQYQEPSKQAKGKQSVRASVHRRQLASQPHDPDDPWRTPGLFETPERSSRIERSIHSAHPSRIGSTPEQVSHTKSRDHRQQKQADVEKPRHAPLHHPEPSALPPVTVDHDELGDLPSNQQPEAPSLQPQRRGPASGRKTKSLWAAAGLSDLDGEERADTDAIHPTSNTNGGESSDELAPTSEKSKKQAKRVGAALRAETKSRKHGRTPEGGEWTREEDDLLLQLRGHQDLPWNQVVNHFPKRRPNSLYKRWKGMKGQFFLEQGLDKIPQPDTPFTNEEDDLLAKVKMVKHYGWTKIANTCFPDRSVEVLKHRFSQIRKVYSLKYGADDSEAEDGPGEIVNNANPALDIFNSTRQMSGSDYLGMKGRQLLPRPEQVASMDDVDDRYESATPFQESSTPIPPRVSLQAPFSFAVPERHPNTGEESSEEGSTAENTEDEGTVFTTTEPPDQALAPMRCLRCKIHRKACDRQRPCNRCIASKVPDQCVEGGGDARKKDSKNFWRYRPLEEHLSLPRTAKGRITRERRRKKRRTTYVDASAGPADLEAQDGTAEASTHASPETAHAKGAATTVVLSSKPRLRFPIPPRLRKQQAADRAGSSQKSSQSRDQASSPSRSDTARRNGGRFEVSESPDPLSSDLGMEDDDRSSRQHTAAPANYSSTMTQTNDSDAGRLGASSVVNGYRRPPSLMDLKELKRQARISRGEDPDPSPKRAPPPKTFSFEEARRRGLNLQPSVAPESTRSTPAPTPSVASATPTSKVFVLPPRARSKRPRAGSIESTVSSVYPSIEAHTPLTTASIASRMATPQPRLSVAQRRAIALNQSLVSSQPVAVLPKDLPWTSAHHGPPVAARTEPKRLPQARPGQQAPQDNSSGKENENTTQSGTGDASQQIRSSPPATLGAAAVHNAQSTKRPRKPAKIPKKAAVSAQQEQDTQAKATTQPITISQPSAPPAINTIYFSGRTQPYSSPYCRVDQEQPSSQPPIRDGSQTRHQSSYQSPFPRPYQTPYPKPYQRPYPKPYQTPYPKSYQTPYPVLPSVEPSSPAPPTIDPSLQPPRPKSTPTLSAWTAPPPPRRSSLPTLGPAFEELRTPFGPTVRLVTPPVAAGSHSGQPSQPAQPAQPPPSLQPAPPRPQSIAPAGPVPTSAFAQIIAEQPHGAKQFTRSQRMADCPQTKPKANAKPRERRLLAEVRVDQVQDRQRVL